jgi:hypothetical protein
VRYSHIPHFYYKYYLTPLKLNTSLADFYIVSPVLGFLPCLAALATFENVP